MMIELQGIHHTLKEWEKDPKRPRKDVSVFSGDKDGPKSNEPFSEDEIAEMKRYLKEHARASYIELSSTEEQVAKLNKEYPLVPHTHAGRLSSTVSRMKAEKEMGIPIGSRTGFAISVKNGKAANAMTESEWEAFYDSLRQELKRDYPDLYDSMFRKSK